MKKFIAVSFIFFSFSTLVYAGGFGDFLGGMADGLKTFDPYQYQQLRKQGEQQRQAANAAATQKFFQDLDFLCPTWRIINTDPNFLQWLRESYPENTQYTKQQVLQAAYSRYDSKSVANMFNEYIMARDSNAMSAQVTKGDETCEERCRSMWMKYGHAGGPTAADCIQAFCK